MLSKGLISFMNGPNLRNQIIISSISNLEDCEAITTYWESLPVLQGWSWCRWWWWSWWSWSASVCHRRSVRSSCLQSPPSLTLSIVSSLCPQTPAVVVVVSLALLLLAVDRGWGGKDNLQQHLWHTWQEAGLVWTELHQLQLPVTAHASQTPDTCRDQLMLEKVERPATTNQIIYVLFQPRRNYNHQVSTN